MSPSFFSKIECLHAGYSDYLKTTPQSLFVGDCVVLYGSEDIEERNTTFEVQLYLPDHVAIGDDSGSTAFLMRTDGDPKVFQTGHGALFLDCLKLASPDFLDWLSSDCPLTKPAKRLVEVWITLDAVGPSPSKVASIIRSVAELTAPQALALVRTPQPTVIHRCSVSQRPLLERVLEDLKLLGATATIQEKLSVSDA